MLEITCHGSKVFIFFHKEITSAGQEGKLTSGKFVSQATGLYKFQVYALTRSDSNLWLELYKNNELVVSIWGHMGGDYADSGNAAVVFLTEGDTVYIQSRDQYDVSLYGAPDEIYSTITGTFIGESTQGKTKV